VGSFRFMSEKENIRKIIKLIDLQNVSIRTDIFMILCFIISEDDGYYLIIDSFMTYKMENNQRKLFECLYKFIDR
jgi:hypothetical protein